MPHSLVRGPLAILAPIVGPLAVCAVLVAFRGHLAATNAALILVVVVVAAAAFGHRAAGALAAVSAAVWFDFFLTQPYERFAITKSGDIITAVLLLLVGLAVSELTARARRLRTIVVTDTDYLAQIHHTAALTQSTAPADTMVDQVRAQLVGLLHLRACRFEYGSLLGHPWRLEQDGSVVRDGRDRDAEWPEPPDEEIELRVFGNGRFYGRFMMRPTPATAPSLQARLVAVTLADQVAIALGSQELLGTE